MSPIQSHILPASPPGREPVNVMTLRNKTQRRNNSPPLSPLLYSFPRPSRLHSYTKQQNSAAPKDSLSSKPLSFISQNAGTLTLDSVRSSSPTRTILAGEAEDRPLTASLTDSFLPHIQKSDVSPPPNPARSPPNSHLSSPIPIPRHTPRQSDPGPFVPDTTSFHLHSLKTDDAPLPSSGIASHVVYAGFRSVGRIASGNAPPPGSSASQDPPRIEGFDETKCDSLEICRAECPQCFPEMRPFGDSTPSAVSDSAPFRFSRFLDPDPLDHTLDTALRAEHRDIFLMEGTLASDRKNVGLHRASARP